MALGKVTLIKRIRSYDTLSGFKLPVNVFVR